ncbi:carboxyl-terminal protease [Ignatzschineria indica]|uniref:Peptidase S41 n=1 Tax=Ignatzschineria indica TaxID=472583 RepID=A0A2U2AK49_9GAMM|nr:S41 family peptidase [Ignatzschineria indica]PWD83160.1 peptidase S41 [Ignatzschineria indica]GGZ82431.1 carboxyl-terminal protease [Ignatzschineria indica]
MKRALSSTLLLSTLLSASFIPYAYAEEEAAVEVLPITIISTPDNDKPKEKHSPVNTSAQKSHETIDLISTPAEPSIPVDDLRRFIEVFDELKRNYVDELSDATLIQNAIMGMLSNLDPHSKYYSAEQFQKIKNETSGKESSIGITLRAESREDQSKGAMIIKTIAPNSPAEKAGLQIGDRIVTIDQTPTDQLSIAQAEQLLQGVKGSTVQLEFFHKGELKERQIVRADITLPSLTKARRYGQFAYLSLSRFQEGSSEEIADALLALEIESKTANAPIQGVILDLRNNHGGLLSAAIDVADLFLTQGVITYTTGQATQHQKQYLATERELITEIPLIILINQQSASAAEIVAGALQDHQRALIVGENSYGKGSVQYAVPLNNGDAIRYTIARYYTPEGKSIQDEGITPDIFIPDLKVSPKTDKNGIDKRSHSHEDHFTQQKRYLLENDYPLYESILLLEGITRYPQLNSAKENRDI